MTVVQAASRFRYRVAVFFSVLGPGFITAMVDNDAGGIFTYSQAGARWGIVDGVTTNPSLIAKEGVAVEEQIRKICDIIDGDISAEVVATDSDQMLVEGRKLARLADPSHRNFLFPTLNEISGSDSLLLSHHLGQLFDALSPRVARHDVVDGDAEGGNFIRERTRESRNRGAQTV